MDEEKIIKNQQIKDNGAAYEKITLVLIDTSAFIQANSDFLGIRSSLIPNFFVVLKNKGIGLLYSEILDKELENHLCQSSIVSDFGELQNALKNNDRLLRYFNIVKDNDQSESDDVEGSSESVNGAEIIKRLKSIDLMKETMKAYHTAYEDSISLPYADPKTVFDKYFNSAPPFTETGKKKSEFPDAFVIESAKVYLASHVKDTLLVVSDDEDWKRAFDNTERAILCSSIKEAVKQINKTEKILSENQISTLLKINLKDLKILLEEEFNQSTYLLDGFSHDDDNEDLTVDEFYEFNIITDPTEIDLLRITRNFIVIQTYATCLVDGSAIVFDEDNSLWDSEDREYTYKSYDDIEFKHGKVETICEITISYDIDKIDDPLNCSQVNSLYFTDNENLEIELDEADIKSHEMSDDDMALRVLREDKGY